MPIFELLIRLLLVILLGTVGAMYLRGWQQLRGVGSPLAKPVRLTFLLSSILLILIATFPPIYSRSHELLYMRAVQKIMMAMVAAPLFWLACPVHITLRGLPFRWRIAVLRALRQDSWSGKALRGFTSTGVAWLTYVAAIVIWHDVRVVDWTMAGNVRHYITLSFLFGAALLYWVHIVGTGLKLRPALPGWVLFAYAVGVEIPNMAAGITIAYNSRPLYSHYIASHERLGIDMIADQIMAGGLVWFMGSVVFFFSAVMIVNRLFLRHGSNKPEYHPEWDSEERMIAPGLEHRLREKR